MFLGVPRQKLSMPTTVAPWRTRNREIVGSDHAGSAGHVNLAKNACHSIAFHSSSKSERTRGQSTVRARDGLPAGPFGYRRGTASRVTPSFGGAPCRPSVQDAGGELVEHGIARLGKPREHLGDQFREYRDETADGPQMALVDVEHLDVRPQDPRDASGRGAAKPCKRADAVVDGEDELVGLDKRQKEILIRCRRIAQVEPRFADDRHAPIRAEMRDVHAAPVVRQCRRNRNGAAARTALVYEEDVVKQAIERRIVERLHHRVEIDIPAHDVVGAEPRHQIFLDEIEPLVEAIEDTAVALRLADVVGTQMHPDQFDDLAP
ncbi:MAG: hypothetical protein WDN03_09355 [Rhizomicrobium sp.]